MSKEVDSNTDEFKGVSNRDLSYKERSDAFKDDKGKEELEDKLLRRTPRKKTLPAPPAPPSNLLTDNMPIPDATTTVQQPIED